MTSATSEVCDATTYVAGYLWYDQIQTCVYFSDCRPSRSDDQRKQSGILNDTDYKQSAMVYSTVV